MSRSLDDNPCSLDKQFYSVYLIHGDTLLLSHEDADLALRPWNRKVRHNTVYAFLHVQTNPCKGKAYAHRLVMARKLGRDLLDTERVDHIDGDGLNNHRDNLRLATQQQNTWNSRRKIVAKSGYRGVRQCSQRWVATFQRRSLGAFDTPEEASNAYEAAARLMYGEFYCE